MVKPMDKLDFVHVRDCVEVVRCKDCKYYRFKEKWREWECDLTGYDMGENWYCADGERMDDDATD